MSVEHLTKGDRIPFTQIPREACDTLTSDALALYVYLMAKPEVWIIRPKDVERRFGWGRERRRTAFRELEQEGYLLGEQSRGLRGYYRTEWRIYGEQQPQEWRTQLCKRLEKSESPVL